MDNPQWHGIESPMQWYVKGKYGAEGPVLPIVLAITCAKFDGREPVLFILHHACYNDGVDQNKILPIPFQTM